MGAKGTCCGGDATVVIAGGSGGGTAEPLTVLDTVTVDLEGLGTAASPLTANVKISPFEPNGLSSSPVGLTVMPADLIAINPNNTLQTGMNGKLYVPPSNPSVTTSDTPTVNLEGDGTVATPLTAAVIPSADAGNALTTGTDGGVFVPTPPSAHGFAVAPQGTFLNLQPIGTLTWTASSLTIALPEAGTYHIDAIVRALVSTPNTDSGLVSARLLDVNTNSTLPSSETRVIQQSLPDSSIVTATAPISVEYTVAGPTTVRLEALRAGNTTAAQLESDNFGRTTLRYQRIA